MPNRYKGQLRLCAVLIVFLYIFLCPQRGFAVNISLSWNPTVSNIDGSTITDLAGYRIYYGTSSRNYTSVINTGNVTSYQVVNLAQGRTYYFSVTAYDSSGNESGYSNEAVRSTVSSSLPAPDIAIYDPVSPVNDLMAPSGAVTAGRSSSQVITVRNDGNADLIMGAIARTDALSAPFSIINDYCSGQTLPPLSACTFTVRFAPVSEAAFSDTFDIRSSDPDDSVVTFILSGTGLSSGANNPPSTPLLVSPANNQNITGSSATFTWKKSSDPDGDPVSYAVYICEDPGLTSGCITQPYMVTVKDNNVFYAGMDNFGIGSCITAIAIFIAGGAAGRRRIMIMITVIVASGLLIVSCGGSSGSGPTGTAAYESKIPDRIGGSTRTNSAVVNDEVSRTVSGLKSATVYYWSVVASDGLGGNSRSSAWSFTTQ